MTNEEVYRLLSAHLEKYGGRPDHDEFIVKELIQIHEDLTRLESNSENRYIELKDKIDSNRDFLELKIENNALKDIDDRKELHKLKKKVNKIPDTKEVKPKFDKKKIKKYGILGVGGLGIAELINLIVTNWDDITKILTK